MLELTIAKHLDLSCSLNSYYLSSRSYLRLQPRVWHHGLLHPCPNHCCQQLSHGNQSQRKGSTSCGCGRTRPCQRHFLCDAPGWLYSLDLAFALSWRQGTWRQWWTRSRRHQVRTYQRRTGKADRGKLASRPCWLPCQPIDPSGLAGSWPDRKWSMLSRWRCQV